VNRKSIRVRIQKLRTGQLFYLIILNLVVTADLGLDAPLIVTIVEKYGLSDFKFALYVIIPFTIVSGIFSLIWGYFSDQYNRRNIILINLILGSCSVLGVGLIFYFDLAFSLAATLRVVSAVGLAGIIPVSMSMVVDLIPEKDRGGIFGWMGISGLVGTGLGFVLSGFLVNFGLSIPYFAGALLGFVFLIFGFRMPEPKRAAGEEILRELIETGKLNYAHRIRLSDLRAIFSKPINHFLFAFVILFTIPASALGIFFIPFLIRNHGFDEPSATLYLLAVFSSQVFGQVFFGRLGDRWYQRSRRGRAWAIILALALSLPFLISAFNLGFTPKDLFLFLSFSGLILAGGFFMVGPNPLTLTTFCDINLPEHRGTVLSLNTIGWLIARIIAAPLCAYLAKSWNMNYGRAFQVMILFFIPASLFLIPVIIAIAKTIRKKQELLEQRISTDLEPGGSQGGI